MNRALKYLLIIMTLGVVAYVIFTTFSQPGISDLQVDFKEVAFYRNENNTGPITRVYAVTVSDTAWGEMKKYAGYMPHNKYGNTKVYFFLEDASYPTAVQAGEENFDESYASFVLAKYEKDGMGRESFVVKK
jgi:hypothetical protein